MRVVNKNETMQVEESSAAESYFTQEPVTHKSYHELADQPVVEIDALAQLHANLEMLSDLQSRLTFVMREVRYLMKV
jgi:hypothetical protein